jgi:mannose-6-phosphate isomerase-like protein (cupin superfamily)
MPHQGKKGRNLFPDARNIKRIAAKNVFYRRILRTGTYAQLVLMSIPPKGETGEENQEEADKILFIVRGKGASVLNRRTSDAGRHDVIFVPAGSLHNLRNVGGHDLKLIAVYSPPLYADGTIQRTVEDAFAARRKKFARAWEQ